MYSGGDINKILGDWKYEFYDKHYNLEHKGDYCYDSDETYTLDFDINAVSIEEMQDNR